MMNDSYSARARDKEDFNSERLWANRAAELGFEYGLTSIGALLGISIDLGSRPISRSAVEYTSDGLAYLTIP